MKHKPFNRHRRRHVREPRRVFYLFCEGQNTEPGYFAALRRVVRDAFIEIQSFGAAGDPKALSAAAIAHSKGLRRRSGNSFEEKDEVWAVFDRDDWNHYYDAIETCQKNGVKVANSNPCFEIWLILHVQEFHQACDRAEVNRVLRKLRADYDPVKKVLNFDELISLLDDAERRGEAVLKRRKEECGFGKLGPPYTMVFELTRSIRAAAKKFR